MKRIAVLFLVLASSAFAQTKTEVRTGSAKDTTHQAVLMWTNPTTCTDGSPCTPVTINVYRLIGTCGAPNPQPPQPTPPPTPTNPPFSLMASLAGNVRTYTDSGLAASTTYCYYVTAALATPPAWSSTVVYTGGQMVSLTGGTPTVTQVYLALNNQQQNLNQNPVTSPTFWTPSTVESGPSNMVTGATGGGGVPAAPTTLTITVL